MDPRITGDLERAEEGFAEEKAGVLLWFSHPYGWVRNFYE